MIMTLQGRNMLLKSYSFHLLQRHSMPGCPLAHWQSPTDGNLAAAVKLVSKLLQRPSTTSQTLYSATQNHVKPKCWDEALASNFAHCHYYLAYVNYQL